MKPAAASSTTGTSSAAMPPFVSNDNHAHSDAATVDKSDSIGDLLSLLFAENFQESAPATTADQTTPISADALLAGDYGIVDSLTLSDCKLVSRILDEEEDESECEMEFTSTLQDGASKQRHHRRSGREVDITYNVKTKTG